MPTINVGWGAPHQLSGLEVSQPIAYHNVPKPSYLATCVWASLLVQEIVSMSSTSILNCHFTLLAVCLYLQSAAGPLLLYQGDLPTNAMTSTCSQGAG